MDYERIKIITEPIVEVIGRMDADKPAIDRWLAACDSAWDGGTGAGGEMLAEFAGRACYWSFGKPRPGGTPAYFDRIMGEAHGSVLHHAVFTVAIAGVGRSCVYQFNRHRAGTNVTEPGYEVDPSQLSQRFYDESDAAVVVPPALLSHVKLWMESPVYPEHRPPDSYYLGKRWADACKAALGWYVELADDIADEMTLAAWTAAGAPEQTGLDWEAGYVDHALKWADVNLSRDARTLLRKRAREAARSVLPECTETRVIYTGNARAWRFACEERGGPHADLEVRRLACAVARKLGAEAPNIFADVEVVAADDGREAVRVRHRKV